MNKNICAIIVRFNMNKVKLYKTINTIKKQVKLIIVIDNSKQRLNLFNKSNIKYFFLGENYGIAHAQNFGLHYAYINKFDYALISDQDTFFPKNYTSLAIPNFKKKVAAISLNLFDTNKKTLLGFVKRIFIFRLIENIKDNSNHRKVRNQNDLIISNITETMASGTIVNLKTLKQIGYMNDDLFLDWVDFEWSWRLNKNRYEYLGIKNLKAKHVLGSSKIKIFNKTYHKHKVERYYYIIRNGLILSLYNNVNFFWRLNIFFNTTKYLFGGLLIYKFNKYFMKYIAFGILHGLINRKGKYTHY